MTEADEKVNENSVAEAAAGGNELKLLYSLRDRIAEEIDTCPTRDLSPLTIRLLTIVEQIKEHEERARVDGQSGTPGSENAGERRSDSATGDGESGTGQPAAWNPAEQL